MALKPDRRYNGPDETIDFFMDAVAERGGIVVYDTTKGSGAFVDDSNAKVVPSGSSISGKVPVGVLMNDMVNLNLVRQHINQHRDEIQKGGKVAVLTRGEVTTNVLDTGVTPSAGSAAYAISQSFTGASATYTNAFVFTTTSTNAVRVGEFRGAKDSNGFVKVAINIPVNAAAS